MEEGEDKVERVEGKMGEREEGEREAEWKAVN